MLKKIELHTEILNLLKKKSKEDHEYINPHFSIGISKLIWDYYGVEDDEVDNWIQDMFGA